MAFQSAGGTAQGVIRGSTRGRSKEGYPTVSFLIFGASTRWIDEVSVAFAGTVNDLTKAKYSNLFRELRFGMYSTMSFNVLAADGSPRTEKGLYSITDAGLHKWRICHRP